MDSIVTTYQTERACRAASEVLEHRLDSLWDAVREASQAHSDQNVTKTYECIRRIDELALSARSTCSALKELKQEVQRNEEKLAKALKEAPYADELQPSAEIENLTAPGPTEPITISERRGPVERSVGGFLRRAVNEPAPEIAVVPEATADDGIPF